MCVILRRGIGLGLLVALAIALPATANAIDEPVLVVPAKALPLDVAVDLPEGVLADTSVAWQLVEQGGSGSIVPVEIVPAVQPDGTPDEHRARLVATISPRTGATGPRRFRLEQKNAAGESPAAAFAWTDDSINSLQLVEGDRPVFTYNYGDVTNNKVPKKDVRRTRGCYVHPIFGLDGEILTDDFPRDHYHHHGLFFAWPHVEIGGTAYDLWTGRGIRQRFVRWLDRRAGPAGATLGVENGWFTGDRKVIIERIWLTVHEATNAAQAIDVHATWIPIDRPITLWGAAGKSYGGMTIRFAVPRGQSGTITVPGGEASEDLAVTRLPWADMTYKFRDATEPSGATLMVSKSHPDYPPTWLTRHFGPLCVGYPGVEKKTFEPGKPFTLRYRLWIHKGAGSLDQFKQAYNAYTSAENVTWE